MPSPGAPRLFHGSPHRIEVGQTLHAGVCEANYEASSPECVYLTKTAAEARQWGGFAHEMHGRARGWVYVYEVTPMGPVRRVVHAEGHVEFQVREAVVLHRSRVTMA